MWGQKTLQLESWAGGWVMCLGLALLKMPVPWSYSQSYPHYVHFFILWNGVPTVYTPSLSPDKRGKEKRMSSKDVEFSLLLRFLPRKCRNPTSHVRRGRTGLSLALTKVMKMLLLITNFSVYSSSILTSLNWIPSYFLIKFSISW